MYRLDRVGNQRCRWSPYAARSCQDSSCPQQGGLHTSPKSRWTTAQNCCCTHSSPKYSTLHNCQPSRLQTVFCCQAFKVYDGTNCEDQSPELIDVFVFWKVLQVKVLNVSNVLQRAPWQYSVGDGGDPIDSHICSLQYNAARIIANPSSSSSSDS